jgi:LPXTG-motif cell wall-anchored protein
MAKRLLLVIGLALGLALAGSGAAGAQEDDGYPPDDDFITVDDTTVVVGQTITVTSGTYAAGASVSHTFASQPTDIGTATAGADGVAVLSATVPNVAPGAHTITATGEDDTGGTLSQSVGITVVAAGDEAADDDDDVAGIAVDDGVAGAVDDDVDVADDAAGALPRTGDDSLPLLRVGAVLLAAGGLLVFLTRRRRVEQEGEAPASV